MGDDEQQGSSFLNRLAELFSRDHNKLKQERGMVEHLQEITDGWSDFAGRAVQFTFANDRGDIVTRDGDLPGIASACNPDGDSKLFCAEYIQPSLRPMSYRGTEGKKPMATNNAGTLVLSEYIANRRFEYGDLGWFPADDEKKYGKEMGDFENVAIQWSNAFGAYKAEKERFETMTGRHYEATYSGLAQSSEAQFAEWLRNCNKVKRAVSDYLDDLLLSKAQKQYKATTAAYEDMLERYAWLQQAELYAHFGPVALIHHPQMLSDFPSDDLGKASIWERIKKAGADRFYRVEYLGDVKTLSTNNKRTQEKQYVDGEGSKQLVSTSIAETPYITNVIDVFVHGKREKKNLEKLYSEPGEHYE